MIYLELTILLVLLAGGWLLTLFSMPGNMLIVTGLALLVWLDPEIHEWNITWTLVAVELGLALLAELLELVAGALGASRHGGSKRGALLAVVGSFLGAIAGASIGLPIPVVGPVAGVILGASCGALAGAVLGEIWKGRALGQSWRVGRAAFVGRLVGSLAKLAISTAMVVVALGATLASFF